MLHMAVQLYPPGQEPIRLGDPRLAGHQLGQGFVHGHGGGSNLGPHIGNAGKLQKALNGAILSVLTVEHREDHINPFPDHAVALEAQ